MKKKKILRVSFIILLACLLTACGQQTGTESQSDLILADNGTSDFTIVYSSVSTETEEQALYLQREIERVAGVELPVMEDQSVPANEESCEILIGYTDRTESTDSEKLTSMNDSAVWVSGHKLVLQGSTENGIYDVVQNFSDELSDLTKDGTLTVPGDYALTMHTENEPILEQIPAFPYGYLLKDTVSGNDVRELVYSYSDSAYEEYASHLENYGFTCYTTSELDNNIFGIYCLNDLTVNVSAFPEQGELQILISEDTVLPTVEMEEIEQIVTPSVTMIGQTVGKYGMGFLFQMSDGTFFIIDGGYADNDSADILYNKMKELSPTENIVIRGWLITHTHDDHAGTYIGFTQKYHGKVTLERLLLNIPGQEMYSSTQQNTDYRDLIHEYATTSFWPGMEIQITHTGQKMYFADALVSILYTQEQMLTQELNTFNDTSVICTVELGGQKAIFLADCSVYGGDVLLNLYPTALQSDILQVAHHGYSKRIVSTELYQEINPSYVFWPSSEVNYQVKSVQNAETNRWLLDNIPASHIWVARDDVFTFELPITS